MLQARFSIMFAKLRPDVAGEGLGRFWIVLKNPKFDAEPDTDSTANWTEICSAIGCDSNGCGRLIDCVMGTSKNVIPRASPKGDFLRGAARGICFLRPMKSRFLALLGMTESGLLEKPL